MSPTPPGKTRERIYRFVQERLLRGAAPTIREIQGAFGFSALETARAHLMALVAEGRLVHEPGRARGYRLPFHRRGRGASGGEAEMRLVPLLGRVQAGALSMATEHLEAWVAVQTRRARDELFALRVRGASMTGAGILPGDIVIVRRQPVAESGEIVVALAGDEATVKTLRRGARGRMELHPANPAFDVLVFPAGDLVLLGKVIEVRRYLDAEIVEAAADF